jgi:hypothetical protein
MLLKKLLRAGFTFEKTLSGPQSCRTKTPMKNAVAAAVPTLIRSWTGVGDSLVILALHRGYGAGLHAGPKIVKRSF